ncbi:hypothetical protein K438DRAFT_1789715 [Mycena galopus ATCC 62051]|nr:hypothetical protein K438DRAFT_1789715 [Mycena galopus ATCC 62051]
METPPPPTKKKHLGPRLRKTMKTGTLMSTVSWAETGVDDILDNTKEVRFVRTFQETLAYLGAVGVEDDVNFWVRGRLSSWKDAKDLWAAIFVTSHEEDAEKYAFQFDSYF